MRTRPGDSSSCRRLSARSGSRGDAHGEGVEMPAWFKSSAALAPRGYESTDRTPEHGQRASGFREGTGVTARRDGHPTTTRERA